MLVYLEMLSFIWKKLLPVIEYNILRVSAMVESWALEHKCVWSWEWPCHALCQMLGPYLYHSSTHFAKEEITLGAALILYLQLMLHSGKLYNNPWWLEKEKVTIRSYRGGLLRMWVNICAEHYWRRWVPFHFLILFPTPVFLVLFLWEFLLWKVTTSKVFWKLITPWNDLFRSMSQPGADLVLNSRNTAVWSRTRNLKSW